MKGGWSSPFAPRVVRSWAEYSKRGGFDKVATQVRENILKQAKEGRVEQEGSGPKARVWVVQTCVFREGCQVEGVYSTKEGAHAAARKLVENLDYMWLVDEVVCEGVDLDCPISLQGTERCESET